MAYDSRSDLITRLTSIRTAIDAARIAESYGIGDRTLRRSPLKALLDEERQILNRIEAIDATSSGGNIARVQFGRPV